MEMQERQIEALERKLMMLIQTIATQAAEIENLRDKIEQQELKLEERKKETDKNFAMDEKTNSQGTKAEEVGNGVSKRIVLHSDTDILRLVTTYGTEIKDLQNNMSQCSSGIQTLKNEVTTLKNELVTRGAGSTYVRWGRNSCPSVNGTELVYSGFTAGSYFSESGGASNYICLSPDPQWGHYSDAQDAGAHVYGTEYQFDGTPQIRQFSWQKPI